MEQAQLLFEYCIANEDTLVELLTGEAEQEELTITIQGWTADLYYATKQSDTTNLVWIDESRNLVFGVYGNIAPKVSQKKNNSKNCVRFSPFPPF